MGVTVRELKREELKIFKDITEKTSHRRDFTDQPLKYYEEMYDLFAPRKEALFLLAEVENGATRGLSEATAENEGASPVTDRPLGRGRPEGSTGASDPSRESTFSTSTPLSAAMFMLYGSEVVYLFSGSDEQYMKDYNAQYELQWYMIKYAAEQKFQRYNFYGIHGLPDDSHKDGVYEFKKGFGGQVLEYIGTRELPVDHKFYQMKKFLKKLRKG